MINAKGYTIIVNYVNLKNNKLPAGNFTLKPVIQKRVGTVEQHPETVGVELIVKIENSAENAFPIDLEASVTCMFMFEEGSAEERLEYVNDQGVRIAFPYLRSLVANVTASSMMPSVMLPLVNPADFKQDNVMQMKKPE